jgi:galactokinase
MITKINKAIKDSFDNAGERIIVVSPGRINLIGEHTDYNEGFVLPAAIDRSLTFAIGPRHDNLCRLYSLDLNETYEGDLGKIRTTSKRWVNYIFGVVDQLQKIGCSIDGFDLAFGGSIPIAAGLSSSAALEGGVAYGLNELFRCGLDRLTLAKLCQRAEHDFVGVQCGIMDQFVNMFGKERKVLKIDCRTLEHDYYPFERNDLQIVLCDTQVKRELALSEYNLRRNQCARGVELIRQSHPTVRSLRDVTFDMLGEQKTKLGDLLYKRCTYVLEENSRVLSACEFLSKGDYGSVGSLMFRSHAGLRDLYEVSCSELDVLVDIASTTEGVLGSRMMGAGFGGCTINLVEENSSERFIERIEKEYYHRTGKSPKTYVCKIKSGTTKVALEKLLV